MEKMKIQAVVEKGSDGLYSIYSEDHFGNSYFGGFGKTVEVAKKDFLESIKEAIQEETAEGHIVPGLDSIIVEYRYDIPSFFNCFDFINVSKFAEYVGVNESKMRACKCGASFPGEKTTSRIAKAIREIGNELLSATL